MGIIRRNQEKMLETILSYLENAEYKIGLANKNKIIIFSKKQNNDRKLHIFLHNIKRNMKEFEHEVNKILYNGNYVSNIFYKDYENFHVRLGEKANFKGNGRSLKKYTDEDLNKILHLRGLEKFILKKVYPKKVLTYYQPETERLPEGLRSYNMEDVIFHYGHISDSNKKFNFVRDGISRNYKIAQEICGIRKNIGFYPIKKGSKILIVNSPRYTAKK